jgi:uncharacterized protein
MNRGGQQMAEKSEREEGYESGGRAGADSRPGRGAQQRGEETGRGGQQSSGMRGSQQDKAGNFANDRDRASEAGRNGGRS